MGKNEIKRSSSEGKVKIHVSDDDLYLHSDKAISANEKPSDQDVESALHGDESWKDAEKERNDNRQLVPYTGGAEKDPPGLVEKIEQVAEIVPNLNKAVIRIALKHSNYSADNAVIALLDEGNVHKFTKEAESLNNAENSTEQNKDGKKEQQEGWGDDVD